MTIPVLLLFCSSVQARGHDGEAERILLEDVQDSIVDMVQIMQSYKSKNMVSKVFVSSLCKKRQEEAESNINAAVQRLQVGRRVGAWVANVKLKIVNLTINMLYCTGT